MTSLPEGVTSRDRDSNGTAFNIRVTLRHPDGRERECVSIWHPFTDQTVESIVKSIIFQWTLHNYSCDCNRANLFARAGGEPDPDAPCSRLSCAYRIVAPEWLVREDP